MMKKCIFFMGGLGKVGCYVILWLIVKGYEVYNIDFVLFNVFGVINFIVDIIDFGEVFNVFIMYCDFFDFELGKGVQFFDVVVYFVVVLCIFICLDNEIYWVNVMGIYNVIEVLVKFGICKVIIVLSEIIYGICFVEGECDLYYLFFDEDYDVNLMDSYGFLKVINEKMVCVFFECMGVDIYVLCIGNVIELQEYSCFFGFVVYLEMWLCNVWCYIDVCDLGQIVYFCIEKDGLGFQVFNVMNDIVIVDLFIVELVQCFFFNVLLKWQFE